MAPASERRRARWRRPLLLGSGLATLVALLPLAYAPASCACVDPATALALHAGMGSAIPVDRSPEALAAGLNRQLAGTTVDPAQRPYRPEDGCEAAGTDRLVCIVPIDRSWLLAREYRVEYRTRAGEFLQASVTRVWWP